MFQNSLCDNNVSNIILQRFFKSAQFVHKWCTKNMKKEVKVARGYRLYPKTQKMILKIQRILNSDADKAVSSACEIFLKEFSKNNYKKINLSLKQKTK